MLKSFSKAQIQWDVMHNPYVEMQGLIKRMNSIV